MSSISTTTITPVSMAPQYTSENLVRGFDFTPQLSITGDTFIGTPTVTATVLVWVDPSPQNILSGSPSLSANSMQILQRVTGGVAGVGYLLHFQCGTAQGNTLVEEGIIYMVGG